MILNIKYTKPQILELEEYFLKGKHGKGSFLEVLLGIVKKQTLRFSDLLTLRDSV